jgi:amino acid adenylation domain-containing protein
MRTSGSNGRRQILHQILQDSAATWPDRIAIEEPGVGKITYRNLHNLSEQLSQHLYHAGVRRGDRVGLYLEKSIEAIASIFAVLRAGAVYVPVDPAAPFSRNEFILKNCTVKAVIAQQPHAQALRDARDFENPPHILALEGSGGGAYLAAALEKEQPTGPGTSLSIAVEPDDTAYILHTSGSTGRPKGVVLSHKNAAVFVNWCREIFQPSPDDRFSSYAPLHFDLSILDIFLSLSAGATLVLIDTKTAKSPKALAALIPKERISLWYSTPTALMLLMQAGLEQYDCSSLRIVLFAGEPFPPAPLTQLRKLLPPVKFYNLYGPTETNVCTFYPLPDEISETNQPVPIGKPCPYARTKVVDEGSQTVVAGEIGELLVAGDSVMKGYWPGADRPADPFVTDPSGERWYRTGDFVREDADGNYVFLGRRDRMVKRHGYRVELDEIEACLHRHPEIKEAAVVATDKPAAGTQITAFIACPDGAISIIELKAFCTKNLPSYMVPDFFRFRAVLPKTSTSKIDYPSLKSSLQDEAAA